MDELAEITQHLLRSSPDALIVIDQRSRIRFANDTVTELLGYRPADLLGRPLDVLVPQRLRGRHEQHIAHYMSEPRNREMGVTIAGLVALRADGTEFPAGIRLAPFNISGRLFVAAAIRDNTERSRINEALVAARQEADRANRAKSRFLATASHDLRQPLQTIRMLNAAMGKLVAGPELGTLLRQQELAIESTIQLLNALLDISRLESGAIEPRCVDLSLPQVFEELRREFEASTRARGLQLLLEPVPVTLSTDRTLFYQLLQNLVGNAVKYTDAGSIRVVARIDNDGRLEISISDTGIGIPDDKLARIFDEYYQVDTHGAKRLGVGLGLAIVKQVSQLLGFEIRIASQLHRGTQALIQIPPQSFSAMRPAPAAAVAAPAPSADRQRQGRIFLVEDNEGVRIATELFLKLEGFETLSAASLAQAQSLLSSIRPQDIVVADYHLDSHTGLDVLADARRRAGVDVPGIILTGDLPSVLRSMTAAVPNTRFLGKPVDTKELLAAIDELNGVR